MSEALLVSIDEAARRLAISRRNVQGLIYEGRLQSVKVGRCRRIAAVDLELFVERLRNDDREPWQPAVVEVRDAVRPRHRA